MPLTSALVSINLFAKHSHHLLISNGNYFFMPQKKESVKLSKTINNQNTFLLLKMISLAFSPQAIIHCFLSIPYAIKKSFKDCARDQYSPDFS